MIYIILYTIIRMNEKSSPTPVNYAGRYCRRYPLVYNIMSIHSKNGSNNNFPSHEFLRFLGEIKQFQIII